MAGKTNKAKRTIIKQIIKSTNKTKRNETKSRQKLFLFLAKGKFHEEKNETRVFLDEGKNEVATIMMLFAQFLYR